MTLRGCAFTSAARGQMASSILQRTGAAERQAPPTLQPKDTAMMMNCPKCDADISDTHEPDDPSVGVNGGWYCDACDLAVGEHERHYEPMEGDIPIMTAREFRGDHSLGTPISELSGRPGTPGYAEFVRIAKSWGYD